MSSQSTTRSPESVTVTVTRRALPGREAGMAATLEGRPATLRRRAGATTGRAGGQL